MVWDERGLFVGVVRLLQPSVQHADPHSRQCHHKGQDLPGPAYATDRKGRKSRVKSMTHGTEGNGCAFPSPRPPQPCSASPAKQWPSRAQHPLPKHPLDCPLMHSALQQLKVILKATAFLLGRLVSQCL